MQNCLILGEKLSSENSNLTENTHQKIKSNKDFYRSTKGSHFQQTQYRKKCLRLQRQRYRVESQMYRKARRVHEIIKTCDLLQVIFIQIHAISKVSINFKNTQLLETKQRCLLQGTSMGALRSFRQKSKTNQNTQQLPSDSPKQSIQVFDKMEKKHA